MVTSDSVRTDCVIPSLYIVQAVQVDDMDTPFTFSSAESLDSSLTLVSDALDTTELVMNTEKGTREKRFSDGIVEVVEE